MAKILGLDVGDVRVGVAVGDTSTSIASPKETLLRANGIAEAEILKLIKELAVRLVVVGLPLDEEGGRTTQCEKVERFCRRLQKRAEIDVHYVDEYLTSVEAEQQLKSGLWGGERALRQKGMLDAVSATIILKTFLEANSSEH